MGDSTALSSSAAGIAVGSLVAGILWWLDASSVLVVGTRTVWAAALGLFLYVVVSDPELTQSGPWSAVIGGSLLFGVLVDLLEIPVSNGSSAALTLVAIGFTLLGSQLISRCSCSLSRTRGSRNYLS